jgi:ankyrin repeat protein
MLRIHAAFLVLAALSAPAAAQFLSQKLEFLKAIKDRDGVKATELLRSNPSGMLDARGDDGNTPLLITIAREDADWAGFLIGKGANVNLANRDGDTPLIVAARVGFDDAVRWLLAKGARVDAANRMGETALIAAVHQREVPVIKMLLDAGADPDKADSAAGYSARDYARRDARSRQILQLIEAKKPKGAASLRL